MYRYPESLVRWLRDGLFLLFPDPYQYDLGKRDKVKSKARGALAIWSMNGLMDS